MSPPYTAHSCGFHPYCTRYANNYQNLLRPIVSHLATPTIYGQYHPFDQNPYLSSPIGAVNPYSHFPNQGFRLGCTPVQRPRRSYILRTSACMLQL